MIVHNEHSTNRRAFVDEYEMLASTRGPREGAGANSDTFDADPDAVAVTARPR